MTDIKHKLRKLLKRIPLLVFLKRKVFSREVSKLDILKTFPLFVPNSAGSYKDKALLTIQCVNQLIPFLGMLSSSIKDQKTLLTDIKGFANNPLDFEAASEIKKLFDYFGSDKSNAHDYHYLYGPILKNKNEIKCIFEIGLGTNNTDVVSNMGYEGRPGASLRAFREYLPNAKIYGADIDRRILFNEDRIETYFLDQTDPDSFESLAGNLPHEIDLIIDDGLHAPNANIQTLIFGITKIKIGGWIIIEDINPGAISFWEFLSAILPGNYKSHLLKAEGAIVFASQRLD